MEKTKYSFFHKPNENDNIPLLLPELKINEHTISRSEWIEFLGVFLDEHLTWKKHKKYAENNIAKKNIGVLFKANLFLNKRS